MIGDPPIQPRTPKWDPVMPADEIRTALAYIEGRIDEWTAAGSHTESLLKYRAAADELHELLAVGDGAA